MLPVVILTVCFGLCCSPLCIYENGSKVKYLIIIHSQKTIFFMSKCDNNFEPPK